MILKTRFKLLLAGWLVLALIIGLGMFYIFNTLEKGLGILEGTIKSHALHEQLKSSTESFLRIPREWALTANPQLKTTYKKKLSSVISTIDALKKMPEDKELVADIGKDILELKRLTEIVMGYQEPVGDADVVDYIHKIDAREIVFLSKAQLFHTSREEVFAEVLKKGETIKKEIRLYATLLILFSTLASIMLIVSVRRMFRPFEELLKATEKISDGELNYRLRFDRKDEFGIMANRFDAMVDKLQNSVIRNAELYNSTKNQLQQLTVLNEFSTSITSIVDLDELLKVITFEFTKFFNSKLSIIRLTEDHTFKIKSAYGLTEELKQQMDMKAADEIIEMIAKTGNPLLVEDSTRMPYGLKTPFTDFKSLICVPLKTAGKIIGTLALYDKNSIDGGPISFSSDDMDAALTFASISAVAIEKAKIYEAEVLREKQALDAKKKMETLFDSVSGGIVTLDKEFKITSANKITEGWINRKAEEIVGENALEVFHDKSGICPHCAAKVTFETGQINTLTQSKEGNYAELSSYPIRDDNGNISECVVFIQDTTDRVLYHEEILSLYKEVAQTKDYLESLIDNSADAIVTFDLNGTITSWNQGAKKIFGYTEVEAIGKFLPFVPNFLIENEKKYIERIKQGEILRDLETLRQKKDGKMIEVNMTLSPIKDTSGDVIGISGISRDISERKRVENELIRRNQELSRLFFISSAMRGTLESQKLLRMILTAVTMSDGLGFNRAILFIVDKKKNVLKGEMGVGPASHDEAWSIWERLSVEKRTLPDIMSEIEKEPSINLSFLDKLSAKIEIPLDNNTILSKTVMEKTPFNVTNAREEPLSDIVFVDKLSSNGYATVPLISRGTVIGVLWVDNFFTRRPITEEDMKFLSGFCNQISSAIENVRLFEKISRAEAELENIFRSISDMVYISDKDYTIKNINKAVVEKIGKQPDEIIGKKCYEIFHGSNEPLEACPHHKSAQAKKAYVEEVKDPYLKGTFLTSVSPLFNPGGEFMGTVHVVRDITELDKLKDKLASAQRMAALGEVAAKVAHEIRNPLVSVGGFARRLEKKLEGDTKEYAVIIAAEVSRLEGILKEILGFVKELRLSKKETDINKLITDILLLIKNETRDKGIDIVKELGKIPLITVDPDRIKEALFNIIDNAVQAVAEKNGKIILKTFETSGYVAVEISDTGTGIDQKDLPLIFNPFYTTKPSGTGLGLSITNRIIEEHEGKIEVKSEINKGTTFKVLFPIKEA